MRGRLLKWVVAPVLVFSFVVMPFSQVVAQENYTFGTETVNKGVSTSPTNRNAEDAAYNSLTEGDQYTDTNYSGSSENVVTGTAGGGAFSSALDTDDATRRTYTEGATEGDYSVTLVPTSDISVGFDTIYPVSPTTHFDKVDDGASHDSAGTYCRAVTNADRDDYGMGDMSAPAGSPDLDVTIYFVMQDAGTGTAYGDLGITISTTDYVGVNDQAAPNSWTLYSYAWEANPAGGEWTYAAVNALTVYVVFADAAPDVDVTTVYLVVTVDYTPSYTLDAQITYSSVASSAQTTNFQVLCQGYRNGDTENIKVQAWNYTSSAWVDKVTISAGSDTDYNFNLLGWAANCERSSGNAILLRLVDASNGDATQTVAYLDVLKVNRVEKGYALDVELTSTTVPTHGDIQLRVKGYTSAEYFQLDVYNYTASGWDTNKDQITDLSNAWQTTIDLCDDHHRSGSNSKIRLVDVTAYGSDTTQDTLYLDVAWISHYHSDPTLGTDGCNPGTAYKGTTIHFWVVVTDYDNELPSSGYPKVDIEGTKYTMVENSSGDLDSYDGKAYYYDKADLTQGVYDFFFVTKDTNSDEVSTVAKQLTIENRAPTITNPLGDQSESVSTAWSHDYEAEDLDSDTLTWELSTNASAWLSINDGTGVLSGTTPGAPASFWVQVWANDTYGGSATDSFDFYVTESAEPPPAGDTTLNLQISGGPMLIFFILAGLIGYTVFAAMKR